jgi:hypothetical protein
MARDQEAGQLEWVNVWASASGVTTDAVTVEPERAPPPVARFVVGKPASRETDAPQAGRPSHLAAPLPDQLMRDIAEIERARDALAAGPLGRRMRTFMVVPSRSAESVPLLIGGVMALVLLSVFAAAAAMTKFGR